jgi:hypothetical protein
MVQPWGGETLVQDKEELMVQALKKGKHSQSQYTAGKESHVVIFGYCAAKHRMVQSQEWQAIDISRWQRYGNASKVSSIGVSGSQAWFLQFPSNAEDSGLGLQNSIPVLPR